MNPLRRLRLDLDVTVQELALAAGVHRDTIRRIEGYLVTPSADTMRRMLDAVEVLAGRPTDHEHRALLLGLPPLSGAGLTASPDPVAAARERSRRRRRGVEARDLARSTEV